KIAGSRVAQCGNVDLINADILESKNTIRPAVTEALAAAGEKFAGRLLLVANLPYNVASPVMMNLVTGPTTCMSLSRKKLPIG
ncbi:MAG: hypothetical protein ACYSW8_30765, partial [Planctomycetota bacterium]